MATMTARPWRHPAKEPYVPKPPPPKSKGQIQVDWELIGATQVTPEGGKRFRRVGTPGRIAAPPRPRRVRGETSRGAAAGAARING